MQAYLGEYPGSRLNSEYKFIRAVNSFINQSHKDSELIIVSDGCEITHRCYMDNFKSNDRIKYLFVDKKGSTNMYELVDGKKFFRGLPRQIARSLVTGEITTYMDSDDFMVDTHLTVIDSIYKVRPNWDWAINCSWYDNVAVLENPIDKTWSLYLKPDDMAYSIVGLDSLWIKTKVREDAIMLMPWLFSHKSYVETKWEDCIGDISEDMDFSKRLRAKYTKGDRFTSPTYVRCHYSNKWDY
jgi:hypothetical protein